ncbi:TerB N-terminal domain-containing protein [Paenibacillus lentus]|uniref:TerB N-terminal domain-containing protein n=1 Tax=Paenibacillus lentus TaxID=1338368 RepID=UPI00365467AA
MNDRTVKYDDPMNHKQRTIREQQIAFAEIDLGQPDRKLTEAFVVVPESSEREVDWRQDFRYVSREQQFVQQAREMEWKAEESAEFVPFQAYWPTYEQMHPGQLRWYLYWRAEVRSARYPETDLSYLFVYLYELIHGIGWREPAQGYELMRSVWLAYRDRYPKLDMYIREWQYDYGLVFGLELPPAEPLQKLPRTLSEELREQEWKRRFTAEPLALTWDMLLPLIDYDIEKSRFYKGQGRKDLQAYAPKVVALVDGYLAKTEGARLLERFMPREKKVSRHLFRTAVYNHELYGRTIPVSVLPVSGHLPLRSYLTQLVRLTENRLREFTGFKGKLRGITVEPEVDQLIYRFLHNELEQRRAEEAKARLPKVKINKAKLSRLQRESDEVRDMLIIEELPLVTRERGLEAFEPSPEPAKRSRGTSNRKAVDPRQAEMVFEGFMDLESASVQAKLQKPGDSEDSRASSDPVESYSDGMAITSDLSMLENETLSEKLNDALMENEGMELPQEWQELLSRLSEAHKKMLSALLDGEEAAVRVGIAEQAGSMPELLLDEINEISMEWIGDLLIDSDEIAEEYRAELLSML